MGGLHHACQAVLHPLESFQLLSGPQQDPWEAPADAASQQADDEEDDAEPGRLHQVWDVQSEAGLLLLGYADQMS